MTVRAARVGRHGVPVDVMHSRAREPLASAGVKLRLPSGRAVGVVGPNMGWVPVVDQVVQDEVALGPAAAAVGALAVHTETCRCRSGRVAAVGLTGCVHCLTKKIGLGMALLSPPMCHWHDACKARGVLVLRPMSDGYGAMYNSFSLDCVSAPVTAPRRTMG